MNTSAKGMRVLVTAGAAGIGRAIAATFVEQGARVHICDIDNAASIGSHDNAPQFGEREGLYGPESESWRLNREAMLLLGAGPRSLLMQIAHPLIAEEQHRLPVEPP